ncbi:lysozyme inhibitor LprI family protein [Methylobacterium sp. J-076]|uniref:lysozyme inhibitor LprI family protein n=1 Tax=Methylobacterium sp. J-076 TaxID=2836655 RepID=UPI001FB954CD|nr:lysozyme inhibitor LprI family protein [Methylobacterium sp. J-076]MCJ2011882.1 lysozyme inhibitor LprI family protein [Methylobacterium sp. J-076]
MLLKISVIGPAGALLLATLSSAAVAEQLTSSDHAKCMDKSGGVTAEMLDCDGAEMKRQDKRLNGAYQKLMAKASDMQKAALRESQRLWLAYRKTTCDLIYKFGSGGTLDSISASSCEVDTLAQRVKFLESLASN